MKTNKLYIYRGRHLVYVYSSQYSVGGRFWRFHYVDSNGNFTGSGGDYNNEHEKFVEVDSDRYNTKINLTDENLHIFCNKEN